MIIRDEIDEARRAWARFAAIEEAWGRAETAQVRRVLFEARVCAYEEVPEQYRYGRSFAKHGELIHGHDGLVLAGWCDAQLERLRGGR